VQHNYANLHRRQRSTRKGHNLVQDTIAILQASCLSELTNFPSQIREQESIVPQSFSGHDSYSHKDIQFQTRIRNTFHLNNRLQHVLKMYEQIGLSYKKQSFLKFTFYFQDTEQK
jgi:hypothetical protein